MPCPIFHIVRNTENAIKAIISNDKIGDLSTLEDGSSVTEIQTAFNELQKSVSEN